MMLGKTFILFGLYKITTAIARPFHLIFNKSLSLGYFPDIWKRYFVTPVHKSGHNITNYGSISKMSFIPKMFEADQKVVFNCLPFHM